MLPPELLRLCRVIPGDFEITSHKIQMIRTFRCAYCNGTGTDYYGLLSEEAVCLVCKGTGMIEVEEPSNPCVFCSGTGKNPLGARVACIVCLGKGRVYSPGNLICPACHGSGRSGDHLPCTTCKGKGVVMKE